MDYRAEYRSKLRSPDEVAQLVKSGDWVDYGTALSMPLLLDAALAKRTDLQDVKVRGNLLLVRFRSWSRTRNRRILRIIPGITLSMSGSLRTEACAFISR